MSAQAPVRHKALQLLPGGGLLQFGVLRAAAGEIDQQAPHGRQPVSGLLPAQGGGGVRHLVGDVLAPGGRQAVQELAADGPQAHQLPVHLIVVEHLHPLLLGHLVFVQAVPHVGVEEVRVPDGAAVVCDQEAAAAFPAVSLHDGLVAVRQLVALGAVVDEFHAQVGGDEAQGRAHLGAVAYEHHLAVRQLLPPGQVLRHGAQVADLLGGVVVVGHTVEHRDGAGPGQVHDGAVLDDPGHHHVHQIAQHPAGVLDGLVSPQLDHAGAQILGVAPQLAHGRFKGHPRPGGGLLKDHAQVHVPQQRRVIAAPDGVLDGQAQLDHVQQLPGRKVVGVDKILDHMVSLLQEIVGNFCVRP